MSEKNLRESVPDIFSILRELGVGLSFSMGPMMNKALLAWTEYYSAVERFRAMQTAAEGTGPQEKFHNTQLKKILLASCVKKVLDSVRDGKWPTEASFDDLVEEVHQARVKHCLAPLKNAYELMEEKGRALTAILRSREFLDEFDNRNVDPSESSVAYDGRIQLFFTIHLSIGLEASEAGTRFLIDSMALDLGELESSVDPRVVEIPLFHPARFDLFPAPPRLDELSVDHFDPVKEETKKDKLGEIKSMAERYAGAYLQYTNAVIPLFAGFVAQRGEQFDRFAGISHKVLSKLYPAEVFAKVNPKSAQEVFTAWKSQYSDPKGPWILHTPHIAATLLSVTSAIGMVQAIEEFRKDGDAAKFFAAVKGVGSFLSSVSKVVSTTSIVKSLSESTQKALKRHLSVVGVVASAADVIGSSIKLYEAIDEFGDGEELIGPTLATAAAAVGFGAAVYSAIALAGTAGAAAAPTGPGALIAGLIAFGLGLGGAIASEFFKASNLELFLRHGCFGVATHLDQNSDDPEDLNFDFRPKGEYDLDRQISAFLTSINLFKFGLTKFRSDEDDCTLYQIMGRLTPSVPLSPGDAMHFYKARDRKDPTKFKTITLTGRTPGVPLFQKGKDTPPFQGPDETWELDHRVPDSQPRLVDVYLLLTQVDDDDLWDHYYELRIPLHNDCLTTIQRKLISDATGIPATRLLFDLPLTIYLRKEPAFD